MSPTPALDPEDADITRVEHPEDAQQRLLDEAGTAELEPDIEPVELTTADKNVSAARIEALFADLVAAVEGKERVVGTRRVRQRRGKVA